MLYTTATQQSPSFTQKRVSDVDVDFEEDDWTEIRKTLHWVLWFLLPSVLRAGP